MGGKSDIFSDLLRHDIRNTKVIKSTIGLAESIVNDIRSEDSEIQKFL